MSIEIRDRVNLILGIPRDLRIDTMRLFYSFWKQNNDITVIGICNKIIDLYLKGGKINVENTEFNLFPLDFMNWYDSNMLLFDIFVGKNEFKDRNKELEKYLEGVYRDNHMFFFNPQDEYKGLINITSEITA